jgi:hypothetical protein
MAPVFAPEIIHYLCFDQKHFLFLISPLLQPEEFMTLLQSLHSSQPVKIYQPVAFSPVPTYYYSSWSICLGETKDIDLRSFSLGDLKQLSKP